MLAVDRLRLERLWLWAVRVRRADAVSAQGLVADRFRADPLRALCASQMRREDLCPAVAPVPRHEGRQQPRHASEGPPRSRRAARPKHNAGAHRARRAQRLSQAHTSEGPPDAQAVRGRHSSECPGRAVWHHERTRLADHHGSLLARRLTPPKAPADHPRRGPFFGSYPILHPPTYTPLPPGPRGPGPSPPYRPTTGRGSPGRLRGGTGPYPAGLHPRARPGGRGPHRGPYPTLSYTPRGGRVRGSLRGSRSGFGNPECPRRAVHLC